MVSPVPADFLVFGFCHGLSTRPSETRRWSWNQVCILLSPRAHFLAWPQSHWQNAHLIVPAEDSHLVFLFFSQIPKIAAVMKGYCKDIYPNELQQSKRKKNNTKHQCKQNNRNEFQYHIPHLAIDIPTGRLEEGHQSPSASTWLNT